MRPCLISFMLLAVFLSTQSALALVTSSYGFSKDGYEREKLLVRELYPNDFDTANKPVLYIAHIKNLITQQTPYDRGRVMAIFFGTEWCSDAGCKLVSLKQDKKTKEWKEEFPSISNGGIQDTDFIAFDKNGMAVVWLISDNYGIKAISWGHGKFQETGYEANENCGTPIAEIIDLGNYDNRPNSRAKPHLLPNPASDIITFDAKNDPGYKGKKGWQNFVPDPKSP